MLLLRSEPTRCATARYHTDLSLESDFRRAWSFVLFSGLSYDDISLI